MWHKRKKKQESKIAIMYICNGRMRAFVFRRGVILLIRLFFSFLFIKTNGVEMALLIGLYKQFHTWLLWARNIYNFFSLSNF